MITNIKKDSSLLPKKQKPTSWKVLKEVFTDHNYKYLFALLVVLVSGFYSILLPYEFTQRLSFINWSFLTPELVVFSLSLGIAMALVITLQVFSTRKAAIAQGSSTQGFAFIMSLLPSMTCCSPLVPTLLAAFGMSAVGVASTSGTIQSFFALNQGAILSFSLVWLLATIVWSIHKIATSSCFGPTGCKTDIEMGSF